MAYKQATINKIYNLNFNEALGNLTHKLALNFVDYSLFQNGIIDIHSSDQAKNIQDFINDEKSNKPLITAKNNTLLRWEDYCSKTFLEKLEKKRGFKTQGVCIVRINKFNRERLSISSTNLDINFYEFLINDTDLQETLLNKIRQYIIKHPTQPVEIFLSATQYSKQAIINENLFKALEADPSKKNFILNEHLKTNQTKTALKKPLSVNTDIKPIWNLNELEQVSEDLGISIETVQAYVQLLRRKAIQLFDAEIDCLYCASLGYTAKETARALGISDHTAREYRKSLIKKLKANSITNAIYIAFKQNILS